MRRPFILLYPEVTAENARTLMQWLRDEQVREYLSDAKDTPAYIGQMADRVNLPVLTPFFSAGGRFYMAYTGKHIPVGFVRLVAKGEEIEIVVVIGDRRNWGKGLGTGTIRESLKAAFFELRAQKVIARIHKGNQRSVRAFVRAGFRLERETAGMHVFSIAMSEYLESIKGGPDMAGEIYITEVDRSRLIKLIDDEMNDGKGPTGPIQVLEREMGRALVVSPEKLPQHVVSMNSKVLLCLNGKKDMEVTLVYPKDANWASGKLSVFSPIGTAILGYGEGEKVAWEVPSGTSEIHIKKVLYQPEAEGDYHL